VWLADRAEAVLAAVEALATATELAFAVVRHAMHVHGAFGMTRAADIHRYHLMVAEEGTRLGSAARLWREAAALRAADTRALAAS
jgi:alkylation response protein AidB-like acyl-CoA dehydrogenase